jgi:hypothetical protein
MSRDTEWNIDAEVFGRVYGVLNISIAVELGVNHRRLTEWLGQLRHLCPLLLDGAFSEALVVLHVKYRAVRSAKSGD